MMFIVSFLVAFSTGVIFAIGGLVMMYFPPKKINPVYGFRTTRSCKNQRNWEFAQRHGARMMLLSGVGNTLVSVVAFVQFVNFGFGDSTLCHCCVALQLGLLIPTLLLAIIPTEIALKRFDDKKTSVRP